MKADLYNARELAQRRIEPRHLTALTEHYQQTRGIPVDGKLGPVTRSSLELADPPDVLSEDEPSLLAIEWIRAAREEIGRGEAGGNNRGTDVDRYRFGRTRGAWCAWFLSWTLTEACARLQRPVPIQVTGGAKRLYRRVGRQGRFVALPETGAVACWDRGARGSWAGHVGLVVRVEGPSFQTIEGNRGSYPSLVRAYDHEVGEGRLLGFAVCLARGLP